MTFCPQFCHLTGMAESYLPISAYGLIGDSRASALVSRKGSIDWCCLPRFDSPSIFGAILDKDKGGCFYIRPTSPSRNEQSYIEDNNVLQTTFEAADGTARLTDAFFATTNEKAHKHLIPEHEIIRVVEGLSGEVSMEMCFSPRPNYGKEKTHIRKRGRLGLACAESQNTLFLRSDLRLEEAKIEETPYGPQARLQFRLRAGEKVRFSLISATDSPAVLPPMEPYIDERLEETKQYWDDWIHLCTYDGKYKHIVRRSALALKLLVFAPSGAIIAAPTMALPEKVGGQRNWDYRYCWLRDASFTVQVLSDLGFNEEAEAFASWILHSTRLTRPELQVLYDIYGENLTMKEHDLEHLEGYKGSRPVRVGNAAQNQFQLDVYGLAMDALYKVRLHNKNFHRNLKKFLFEIADTVCRKWQEPDNGIWEERSERSHHTYSKVMAWVALDRIVRLNQDLQWGENMDNYKEIKEDIRQSIETKGYNDGIDAYVGIYETDHLDASLLTLPLYGYCDASSERMQKTYKQIRNNLVKNELTYRYTTIEDGLPHGEGAFLACSFWRVSYLAKAGQTEEAERVLDRLIEHGNQLQLWPEEMDTSNFNYLGNYPQAFSHVDLINAVFDLEEAKRGRKRREP